MLAPTSFNADGLALAEASTALTSPAAMPNLIKDGGIQDMLLPLPDNLEHPDFVDELLTMLQHHGAMGSTDNPVLAVDSPLPETTARAGASPLSMNPLDSSGKQVIELPKRLGMPLEGAPAAAANDPATIPTATIPTAPLESLQPVAQQPSLQRPTSDNPHVVDKTISGASRVQPGEQLSPGPLAAAEGGESSGWSDEAFASRGSNAATRSSEKGPAHPSIEAIPPDANPRTPTETPVTITGREGAAGEDLSTTPPNFANTQIDTAATQTAAAGAIKGTTPVEPTAILSAVAEHVVSAKQSMENGHARLEITLDPPELGRITVELSEADDKLAAKLIVTEAATLETIKQSMSSMMDSLSEAGIDLDDFQLESFLQHQQSDGETDSEQSDPWLQQEPVEEADATHSTRVRGVNILA